MNEIRKFIVQTTVKTLGVTERTANLRLNALLKSGILDEFESPDNILFKIAVDTAMKIPQLGEKED